MRAMSIALLAKLLPKQILCSNPWNYYMWHFIGKAKAGNSVGWNHLTREEKLLPGISLRIKLSPLLDMVLQAWKVV
eukprot:c31180_g1_i1 orf=2-226(-)